MTPDAPEGSTPTTSIARRSVGLLRSGPAKVAVGLGFFGLSTYVFTAVVLRALGPERFADFNLFWGLVYGLGLGVMLPFEQETSRRTSLAVHTDGRFPRVLSAALVVALAFSMAVSAVALVFVVASGKTEGPAMFATTVGAYVALGITYVSRGGLSGRSQFGRYSGQLFAEGTSRLLLVGLLFAAGATSPAAYAVVVPVGLLVAVAATVRRQDRLERPQRDLVRGMAGSIGPLVIASTISLTLVNFGPFAVRYVHDVADPTRDGSFLAAAFIARLPIFAFAAVQAVLIPRLARSVARHDRADFRSVLLKVLVPTLGLGAVAVVVVAVAGPWLLGALAGPQYHLPRVDMVLLTAAYGCYLVALVLQPAAITLGMHRQSTVAWVVGALTFGVAWLLPVGAAAAVSIAIATVCITVSAGLALVVSRGLARRAGQWTR